MIQRWAALSTKPTLKRPKGYHLIGVAVLNHDDGTKLRFWSSCDDKGREPLKHPVLHPMVISTRKFPVGTRVEIYLPENSEMSNEPTEVEQVQEVSEREDSREEVIDESEEEEDDSLGGVDSA